MNRLLLFLAGAALPMVAMAQGTYYELNPPAPAVQINGQWTQVYVCPVPDGGMPCPSPVPIFKNEELTVPITNPHTLDVGGQFAFYAPPGLYTIQITAPYQLRMVELIGATGAQKRSTQQDQHSNGALLGVKNCGGISSLSNASAAGCDLIFGGINPATDVRHYGVRAVTIVPQSTATCTQGNTSAKVTSAMSLQSGDGVLLLGCGAANMMSTPAAPTLTPIQAAREFGSGLNVNQPPGGTNTYCVTIAAADAGRGLTPSSAETCISNSYPLGAQHTTITKATRSGSTVTVNFSSTPPISPGVEVGIAGTTDDMEFGGYWTVTTVDKNRITIKTSASTAYGAGTEAMGGTMWWFNGIEVGYPAVKGTQAQYVIGLGPSSGTEVPTGISLPNPGTYEPTTLLWDYFGKTISEMGLPFWVPATMPTASIPDELSTTCTANCSTTVITLATAPISSSTGKLITFDDSPTIKAAAVSITGGGQLQIPMPSSPTAYYPIFAPLSTSVGINFGGNIYTYDTWTDAGGTWRGWTLNNSQFDSSTQFVLDSGHIQIVNRGAYPSVLLGADGNVRGITFNSRWNNSLGVLDENYNHHALEDLGFLAGPYSGVGYYYLASSTSGGFGFTMNHVYILGGTEPGMGTTFAPVLITKNTAEMLYSDMQMEGRGAYMGLDMNTGGFNMRWTMGAEEQGGGLPMFEFYESVPLAGWIHINDPIQDTIGSPLIIGYGPNFNVTIDGGGGAGSNMPLITGNFGNVHVMDNTSVGQLRNVGQNVNAKVETTGATYDTGFYHALGAMGAGQVANPTVAPTIRTTTTCADYVKAGTYHLAIAYWDATSVMRDGTGGHTLAGPATTYEANGHNCAIITRPTPDPVGALYWGVVYTDGGSYIYAENGSSCGPSFIPLSFSTITFQNNYYCGSAFGTNTTTLQEMSPSGTNASELNLFRLPNTPHAATGLVDLYNHDNWPSFSAYNRGSSTAYGIAAYTLSAPPTDGACARWSVADGQPILVSINCSNVGRLSSTMGIVYNVQSSSTNGNISATNMVAETSALHDYLFLWTVSLTAAGSSCTGSTTVLLNVIFTDPNTSSATTQVLGTIVLANGGNGTVGFVANGTDNILTKSNTSVKYSTSSYTAGTGCTTNPKYQVSPTLVQMW